MSTDHTHASDDALTQLNQILGQLSLQVRDLFEQKDFRAAQPIIEQVLAFVPNHPIALMNLATVHLRQQHYVEAYQLFQQAEAVMGEQVDAFVYNGLTEVCHFLNQKEQASDYGRRTIQMKKKQVSHLPAVAIPDIAPPHFNSQNRSENIISYSLFGNLPRYCEVAILNVQLAKEMYPAWTCRFYIDEAVSEHVVQRLIFHGAQIIRMNEPKILGFFWRFLVMDDPSVKRFLIRDADSLLSYRESAAVDEWLNSKAWFHVMRDFYPHTELILAGMWGGCTGIFKDTKSQMIAFIQAHQHATQRELDQVYLRECIWPTLKHSVFCHDSQHYDAEAVDFPVPTQLSVHEQHAFHIGANEAAHIVSLTLQHAPADEVTWILYDQYDQEVCRYDVQTQQSLTLHLILPRIYVEKIKSQEWYVISLPKV